MLCLWKKESESQDMGLAKFVVGKTYTTCGTPDYFAPELISASGHTHLGLMRSEGVAFLLEARPSKKIQDVG